MFSPFPSTANTTPSCSDRPPSLLVRIAAARPTCTKDCRYSIVRQLDRIGHLSLSVCRPLTASQPQLMSSRRLPPACQCVTLCCFPAFFSSLPRISTSPTSRSSPHSFATLSSRTKQTTRKAKGLPELFFSLQGQPGLSLVSAPTISARLSIPRIFSPILARIAQNSARQTGPTFDAFDSHEAPIILHPIGTRGPHRKLLSPRQSRCRWPPRKPPRDPTGRPSPSPWSRR